MGVILTPCMLYPGGWWVQRDTEYRHTWNCGWTSDPVPAKIDIPKLTGYFDQEGGFPSNR